MAELRFTFDTTNQKNEEFFVQLRRYAAENHWLPAVVNEVELILEEWLTNVRNYGLANQKNPQVRVAVRAQDDVVQLEITDNGVAFDPTKHQDPDVTAPIEQRPIGGLGIFMMRKLSHRICYERSDQWNRVVIEKDLARPVLSPKT